jgi:alpha-2-macroglobulin
MRDATTRRPVRLAPAILIAVALVAGCGSPAPSPQVHESPSASSTGQPAAEPGASAPPSRPLISVVGDPDDAGWSRITVAEAPPVAMLEPVTAGERAVATDTEFRLRSLDGRDPRQLAKALVAEPAIAFAVVSATGDTTVLRPEDGLVPGTTYRIALMRPDGSAEAAWIAKAASPLRVTGSVPGDAATRVPLDTAIEVTFDQYGVTARDFASNFSIAPAVDGRFEVHGRSIAFLPVRPLARNTLYTVTIRRGLPLPGTGEVLERDAVIRFETVGKVPSKVTTRFVRTLVEASTTARARITVAVSAPNKRSVPRSLAITVHRVQGIDEAIAAWHAIAAAPEWTRASRVEPVATTGLERVYAGTVPLKKLDDWGTRWFAVPKRLPAGWYVVTERWAGIPRQVLLQITDLATYALVASDRTAVWVNDVRTGETVAGARASLAGQDLGRTDKRGLLVAPTPGTIAGGTADREALLVVRHDGQATFRGTGLGGKEDTTSSGEGDDSWYEEDWGIGGWGSANDAWWRLFSTDRQTYRSTDTINAWGMARGRDSGTVPGRLVVRLRSEGEAAVMPLVATGQAAPDANGAFAAALPIRDLPDGSYTLELVADGSTIAEQWLEIGELDKPAWQMDLAADRRAVISGEDVTVTARAWFFEGTPVAGTRIDLGVWVDSDGGSDYETREVTDAFGTLRYTTNLWAGKDCQPCWASISATPHVEEDADIEANVGVDVFAASVMVDAEGRLDGTRLRVSGKVSDVDFRRYEQVASDGEVDPRGAGRAAVHVRLQVVEHWTVRRQTGTRYDAIEKKVVPVYETTEKQRTVADESVTTQGSGAYAATFDVVGGRRSYEITAWSEDEQGRTTRTTAWANEVTEDDEEGSDEEDARLVNADSHADVDGEYDGLYRVGDTVRVRFTGGIAHPRPERYLYAIAQRGLRYVTVGDTPTFRSTFDESWLPGAWITGVRFTGDGYETTLNTYSAAADLDDRALSVSVTPDRDRYGPGDTATVAIRTRGRGDVPVAASVYVKAVDEKLYAIDAANDIDPLQELYAMVGDGVLATVRSHRAAEEDRVECCDTTGGGDGDERSDFRDWLVATMVTTDQEGRATLEIPLSDDLTSWRVVAAAVDGSLRAGQGAGRLTVGLPFFAEATLKSEYLAADRPVIRVRGFGSALREDDRVTFTISSETLPMTAVTLKAPAFVPAEVQLPRLSVGEHAIRIEARAGDGRSDVLVRTFRVVDARAVRRDTTWGPLAQPTTVASGTGRSFTYLTLVDAGRGRVIPLLERLAWTDGVRSDQRLAAGLARRILAGEFGMEVETGAEEGLDAFWRKHGLALVAHGSAQLEVTALAAMAGDPGLDAAWLRAELEAVAFDNDQRRDRRLVALAGLAALGEPVLEDVRAAAGQQDLTLDEQVSLALAALHAGDETLAGRLERAVLDAHGRARGAWLRMDTGDPEADALQTARLAIVSASLGRSYAADMDAWLEANPPHATVVDLERVLAARGWVQRVPSVEAVAALWVDGDRRELPIRDGSPVSIQLTPAQAASARLEPVSGSVLVVTQRDVPLHDDDLTRPDGVTVTRTVRPAGVIGPTDTVVVTLTVRLAPAARAEGWTVTDWAPSGLSPIDRGDWNRAVTPDTITGQRVVFHVGANRKMGTWTLRYIARVVTPGTYRWEPAILQSDVSPNEGIQVPQARITIAGLDAGVGSRATPKPSPAATAAPQPTATPATTPEPVPAPLPTPGLTPSPSPSPTPATVASPAPVASP